MSQVDEEVQTAERRAEELAKELAEARAEAKELTEELKETREHQELMRRLAAEGTRDLEAAVLIAKSRLGREGKADLAGIVERLKKEKGYLFHDKENGGVDSTSPGQVKTALRTSSAREPRQSVGLERSAKRAAGTGSRADLQEYMKKRRVVGV